MFCAAAAVAWGCHQQEPSQPRQTPPEAPAASPGQGGSGSTPSQTIQAPARVSWKVVSSDPKTVTLLAQVHQLTPLAVPLNVSIETPPGVRLISGPSTWTVPPTDKPCIHETRLTFAIDTPPTGDLLLVADARGTGFGIHATNAYRFGRPEPTPALPKPTGPEVKLGPRKFGPAVPSDEGSNTPRSPH
ncbi:hypothetical protein DAT35_32265 [Vitiosangium sp. GDMCC 1.1324]|nr:hypothetical protein DAT35_32265 [Vitiosangium sp. GDMCC 1.1324]